MNYGIIQAYKKLSRNANCREHGRYLIGDSDMRSISRTPSIYQIRHIESGRVYVGSARDPRVRCAAHFQRLNKGSHHSRYLQNAWDKYGKDAFVFEVIEPVLFIEDLIAREQYWIDTLRAADRKYGFNVFPTAGSNLGQSASDETRANLRRVQGDPARRAQAAAAAKARWSDPEFRAKQLARMADPTYRAKLSVSQKGRWPTDPDERVIIASRNKRELTEATRAKMSARAKALWADPDYCERMPAVRSESAKVFWEDPEYRAKQVRSNGSPEARAAAAARTKALWADPNFRAKVMEARAKQKKKKD